MTSAQTQNNENEAPAPGPVNKLRYGKVEAAIWENTNSSGDGTENSFFSVTLAKKFRQGETWKESKSFDERDLPSVAKIANDAHTWIQSAKLPPRE